MSTLTEVSFPNVQTIGEWAFGSCYSLETVYLMTSSVVSFATGLFPFRHNLSTLKLYVPSSLYDDYITQYSGVSIYLGSKGSYTKSITDILASV